MRLGAVQIVGFFVHSKIGMVKDGSVGPFVEFFQKANVVVTGQAELFEIFLRCYQNSNDSRVIFGFGQDAVAIAVKGDSCRVAAQTAIINGVNAANGWAAIAGFQKRIDI
jgi:hypothetical protein